MAELDCAEFSLPAEFPAEDIFLEMESGKGHGDGRDDGDGDSCFPSEFPYDWVYLSDVSSPVEAVAGMESGDQECVAGLSRQMVHYFLREDEKVASFPLAGDDPKVLPAPDTCLP